MGEYRNPFEGWTEPLPRRLAGKGFRHEFADVGGGVTISHLHGPPTGPPRRLADYFRGQDLPVSERRVKRMPGFVVDLLDRGVRRWEQAHPGEPSGFAAWWVPSSSTATTARASCGP